MTLEKLYVILKKLIAADEKLSLQASLEQVKESLSNLANSPAATQWQNSLATGLANLTTGAQQLAGMMGPSELAALERLNGTEFFDPKIAESVRDSIERNAMTPTVARDFVTNIANTRASFLQTVTNVIDGLKKLGISESAMTGTPADAAFSIPRDLFNNQLGDFATELRFLSQLLERISEATTGKIEPPGLESLSSSDPIVAVTAALTVLVLLGQAINLFLDGWQKMAKMRNVRGQLEEIGATAGALQEVDERITTTVEEVVEESTTLVLAKYPGENHRKNELGTC